MFSDGRIYQYKGKILTCRENQDGYYICKISKHGSGKYMFVHRLVSLAFIPNPDHLPEINHIDCNRKNNSIDNLEWCTRKYNVRYAIKNGNHYCCKDLTGANNPNYKNHILHDVYSQNPKLAVEKLARPRGQNGKAKPIILFGTDIVRKFQCIADCADYVNDTLKLNLQTNSICNSIRNSIKKERKYKGFNFKFL